MHFKKWLFPETDKQRVAEVAEDCGLDPLVVLIAFARGICDPYEIEQFVGKEPEFSDPYEYSGIGDAVSRINIALDSGEKILVFGDYDCDGVTATALLVKYLKSKGANVDYLVPNRENDGYGISLQAIEKAALDGFSLIITVDNGINAVKEVARANELGIDIVITDHHIPQDELPDAVAIIDPHIDSDNDWLFRDLCGVGVAFKLVCALEDRPCEEMIYEYADLVSLGTIADLVPLINENRTIVNVGIDLIRKRHNVGIKALLEVSGTKYVNSGNIAFTLCPRINAAGRMSSADIAVKLLLSENIDDAMYYANCLDSLNLERQGAEQKIFDTACEIIEQNGYNHDRIIVVDGENWHVGVIGIAASKLVEKYGKPCIVINADGDRSVGSGRSINGFSLFDAIFSVSELLVKFGGHELAAGLTIKQNDISKFRNEINKYALKHDIPFQTIKIDCKIKPRALTVDVAKALKVFEPYGAGNAVPLFAIMESKIIAIQPLSNGKHIRLKLRKDSFDYYAVMFGTACDTFDYKVGDIVDIAVTIDVNVYNENESVSIIVRSLRKSGINEENMIMQISALDKLYNNSIINDEAKLICPNRDETITVFRYIKSHSEVKYSHMEYDLGELIGYGKLNVILNALEELGIIRKNDNFYSVTDFNGKADLDSADILKKLHSIIEGGDLN